MLPNSLFDLSYLFILSILIIYLLALTISKCIDISDLITDKYYRQDKPISIILIDVLTGFLPFLLMGIILVLICTLFSILYKFIGILLGF